jgi:predicted DNA-binding transcriptional regulator AlpA
VSLDSLLSLDTLDSLPDAQLPAVLAHLAAAQTKIAARLAVRSPVEAHHAAADELLDAGQAAAILSVSKDWLYRRTTLPFRVEVSPKQTRYSRRGIERWLAMRTGTR